MLNGRNGVTKDVHIYTCTCDMDPNKAFSSTWAILAAASVLGCPNQEYIRTSSVTKHNVKSEIETGKSVKQIFFDN
jgi:hypothetical protein